MKTYIFSDKNSSATITITAADENEAVQELSYLMRFGNFRLQEEVEEEI